ncbi:NAD(P)-dependent oxidoreductase [Sphingobium jiangsuense]|uniref:dTDP-4-dehydrorhamnose reductase n=1 Tax=Sphingobium jiangsuense TaxID=870476 RepID=A0A7W6BN93_9SPHN|nr:dTDP-4-dehydrorhamnose reductase [Sphingobium jiangsuense]MBB3924834.1 dTDP-4-dehydrorhamnose reductase [Sphingobium jiangsuense]GLT02575.1 NAD(P)-dependent oxidoreductase [Sphingobium jiangsuense]
MKALIVGANGQVGRCLQAAAPTQARLVCRGSDGLDIRDRAAVAALVAEERPDILFNAAAYTAVDRAEGEEALALSVNGGGVANLAEAADRTGARLVHISTDFVFDGASGTPYAPDAPTRPLCAYGRTKLAGEGHALALDTALVVRTAWVYAPEGGNFVRTMLRLMAERPEVRPEVRVVADQIGTPTYAPALARALWNLALGERRGVYHYTDSGVASWYDFAVAIREEALAGGVLDGAAPVLPIPTSAFPTPARRPPFSVLDKEATWAALGGPAPHWRENLRLMLKGIAAGG